MLSFAKLLCDADILWLLLDLEARVGHSIFLGETVRDK